jgi:predicted mannosyl-3-phosphoglycerate phosphatase (HAD superfamily)
MTTDTPTITEVDCSTGIQTVREMTAEEITDWEAMKAETAVLLAAREAEVAAALAAKESAQAKLAALGLTAEEIAALTK